MSAELDKSIISKCVSSITSGRSMVACQNIKGGQLIFSEIAYCVSPNFYNKRRHTVCIFCCRKVVHPFNTCVSCRHVYCSEECYNLHHTNHINRNECEAFQFVNHIHNSIQAEDIDTFQMIYSILARRQNEIRNNSTAEYSEATQKETYFNMYEEIPECENLKNMEVETVGINTHICEHIQFCDNSWSYKRGSSTKQSTFQNVESLITNVSKIDRDILLDFAKLCKLYKKKVNKWNKKYAGTKEPTYNHTNNAPLPNHINESTFVSLCAAFLCNGFGMWDEDGKLLASMLYPQCSFFNHSCAPNIGRCNSPHSRVMEFYALRDIRKGEELCISYVDVKLPAEERQKRLFATYSFHCECSRCCPEASFEIANTVCEVSGVPPLCSNCACKFLRPVQSNIRKCLWCNVLYHDDNEQNPLKRTE